MSLVLVIFFANDVSHNIKWHSRAEDLATPVSSHACVCMVVHICVNRRVHVCMCPQVRLQNSFLGETVVLQEHESIF